MTRDADERKQSTTSALNLPETWIHDAIGDAYGLFGKSNENHSDPDRPLSVKGLDMLQILPYGLYYGAYEAARGINWVGDQLGTPGKVAAHGLALTMTPFEAAGLAANEALGLGIIGLDHGKGNLYEGIHGGILPSFLGKSPEVYLPGIHSDGKIDFEW